MNTEQALELLRRTGVMQEGHFRLTSGRHSDRYMQCARLFEFPEDSAAVCAEIAKLFTDCTNCADPAGKKIELVVGPALGGVIMAYEVARAIGARNIFAEREKGAMTLRRGFYAETGTRALVVEDVVTTGGSVREVINLLRAAGVEVAGVGSVVDRSGGTVDFGVPFHALVRMDVQSWEADDCPLCRQGLPIVKPGSRT